MVAHTQHIQIISLCSGVAGLDIGVQKAIRGMGASSRTVCYVEREAFAAAVLAKQMARGALDAAPIWSGLSTFDARAFYGRVGLIVAGYPCQGFSVAGKQRGEQDERYLWPEVLRVLRDTGAGLAFFENVRGHVNNGLRKVLEDLSGIGFNAEWDIFSAEEEGAPHRRERLFILAYRNGIKLRKQSGRGGRPGWKEKIKSPINGQEGSMAHTASDTQQNIGIQGRKERGEMPCERSWWEAEPSMGRVVDGFPGRVDRVRSLGNAVVPQCAERAFCELWERASK